MGLVAITVKVPASLVVVPIVVPVTTTAAPKIGAPVCWSMTIPWTVAWACRSAGHIRTRMADSSRFISSTRSRSDRATNARAHASGQATGDGIGFYGTGVGGGEDSTATTKTTTRRRVN